MTLISYDCPECGEEIADIEADVSFDHQDHPYGSTTAREELVEIEMHDDKIKCEECGYVLDGKEYADVEDRMQTTAQDERWD